jgi:hypothetical protein
MHAFNKLADKNLQPGSSSPQGLAKGGCCLSFAVAGIELNISFFHNTSSYGLYNVDRKFPFTQDTHYLRLGKNPGNKLLVPCSKECYKLFLLWYNTLSSDVQS